MSTISDFKTPPFDLFSTTSATTPVNNDLSVGVEVGGRFRSSDGREYVLVQNAGTALGAGVVVQGPAAQANSGGLSPATTGTTGYSTALGPIAAAIGGKSIQLASSSTAILANRFAGGYLTVVSSTGLSQTLKVASNSAASTTSAFNVTTEDPFTTATSTGTTYTLTINPYGSRNGTDFTTDGVIISPATTLTGQVIGVTSYPIPASTATVPSYGFVQTRGPVAVLGSSTVALGLDVAVPSGTAGAVLVYAVATTTRIGTAVVATASGAYNLINLQL